MPCWVDHATRDIHHSNAFYERLFGWESDDQGEELGHYTLFRKDGRVVAGNSPMMDEGQSSRWSTYISVDDADATIARASAAGATVSLPPMEVMDLGRMAVFADSVGAAVGLWQPKSFHGAELVGEVGGFVWTELNSRDLAAERVFYRAVFGWEPIEADMGAISYTEWKLRDNSIAGMLEMPQAVPSETPAHWLAYFGVEDTDATVERARELGGAVLLSPTDIPPGRFAVLTDIDGATFAVITTEA
jgi:predicted enzyme related to lactoylglutathione lyase